MHCTTSTRKPYLIPTLAVLLVTTSIARLETKDTAAAAGLTQDKPTSWREATVEAKGAKLKVRITLPKNAKKPCPALVIVHGSGRVVRTASAGFGQIFSSRGFAIVTYDKRGCGDSTGHYTAGGPNMLQRLAGDAAAVHRWLAKQKGIDTARIGFAGGSQAGWIMPLAADLVPNAAFIIALSGPTVSVGEENYYSRLTGDGSAKGMSIEEADRRTARYRGPRYYDPRPVLKKLDTPTLWLFGGLDESIPPHLCVIELSKIIVSGNPNHTMHVVPRANHNLRNTKTNKQFQMGPLFETWFREQGILE